MQRDLQARRDTSVPNLKSRTLSIRISDKEYNDIKARCRDAGDLTVSEFVRAAMLEALRAQGCVLPPHLEVGLSEFHSRLDRLEARIEDIARQVQITEAQ